MCVATRADEARGRSSGIIARVIVILALVLTVGATDASSEPLDYANPAHWICRPDRDDVCDGDLSATVVDAQGTLTVQPLKADPEAPIDCFYVYPTVSKDEPINSDTNWGPGEELWTTYIQAAPLAGGCRLFAPGYRQLTISGLASNLLPNDVAYGDVLAAWRYYLEHDNHGRGVILVGHSQDSWTLAWSRASASTAMASPGSSSRSTAPPARARTTSPATWSQSGACTSST